MIGASIPFRHSIHHKYEKHDVVEFKIPYRQGMIYKGQIFNLSSSNGDPTYSIIAGKVIIYNVPETEILRKVGHNEPYKLPADCVITT